MKMRLFHNKLNHNSVKEAFDNLPCGICIFDRKGLLVLCNIKMYQLICMQTGHDLQHISDIYIAFGLDKNINHQKHIEGISLLDRSVWAISSRIILDEDENEYVEYIASNVTEIYLKKEELKKDNKRLEKMVQQMRKMSEKVLTVTYEEEVLALKMKVHDQMGRSLIATKPFLEKNASLENVDTMIQEWKNAIDLLECASKEKEEQDLLEELEVASKGMIEIITTGNLPKQEDVAYLMVVAIRECLTNALRYAKATELYVCFKSENDEAELIITNNGEKPKEKIMEGGGLSSLRKRIEKNYGSMSIQSFPRFELRIQIPYKGVEVW